MAKLSKKLSQASQKAMDRLDLPVNLASGVARMELLGATGVPVTNGSRTLTDAINAPLRDWVAAVEHTHDQRRTAALAQAVNALGRAVTGLENQLMPTLQELQEAVLTHAFALAEAIVGRALDDPDGRGADALRRAMAVAPDQGEVTVSLHPDDYRHLVGTATEADYNYGGRPVHLRPDPALQPGDAVAETGSTTVDASIAAAVRRAREALRLREPGSEQE